MTVCIQLLPSNAVSLNISSFWYKIQYLCLNKDGKINSQQYCEKFKVEAFIKHNIVTAINWKNYHKVVHYSPTIKPNLS
jgi:hypothetical protein